MVSDASLSGAGSGSGQEGDVAVRRPHRHDSAIEQVTGRAAYVDDMPVPSRLVHLAPIGAPRAPGRLVGLNGAELATMAEVRGVLTAADIPGANDVSPVHAGDDPVFASDFVHFVAQPVAAVVAGTRQAARQAASRARVTIEPAAPVAPAPADSGVRRGVYSLAAARQTQSRLGEDMVLQRGTPEAVQAAHRLACGLSIGGQEHFYLEGHVTLAVPEENGLRLYCSTQHPSEIQHLVAAALGWRAHRVVVQVRRLGGAFGGKESQAAPWAVMAALAAVKYRCAAKVRLDRDDDMAMTGKRHAFDMNADVKFDEKGVIRALSMVLSQDCGASWDLSAAVAARALYHADNAYYYPCFEIRVLPLRTHTVSSTAFRGFGAPQGVLAAELVQEHIARFLGLDPLTVRLANLYRSGAGRDTTPYGQTVLEPETLRRMMRRLAETSAYASRRQELAAWNQQNSFFKRGLALTPVKFGVSFTRLTLNQAGALVHLYQDGSVHLNHGGIEMGQGLFTKIVQIVAETFQISPDTIRPTATSTDQVPNTSPTAASSGTDLNGQAARQAALVLKERLTRFACENWHVRPDQIVFSRGRVRVGNQTLAFPELVRQAYEARVSLSSTGFYRTPEIGTTVSQPRGEAGDQSQETQETQGGRRLFYYYAHGVACSEVRVDLVDGTVRVERTDILHDAGNSLNPALDIGQIEGAFIQGLGWLTAEELVWNAESGRLLTHAPSTYKIPTAQDRPEPLSIELWQGRNPADTIFGSKAVGEPPLMLANSVFFAIMDAVSACGGYRYAASLSAPATPERVFWAVRAMQQKADTPAPV